MTSKVLTDLTLGRFSFRHFSSMRIRRIYPALAVVTVSSVVAGWFVTLPREYLKHLLQALSALTFVSNFAFDSDNGYFAMAAQTKPLLHTWSLSVEWQFYIWMPLVVALVWRLASASKSPISTVVIVFQVVAALSLAWCLWESHADAVGSSFFSLRARAWEPLAGGLIAATEIRRWSEGASRTPWLQNGIIAAAGWTLVAICVIYPLPESQWPSVLAILPVMGAAMIVGARQWNGEASVLRDISIYQRLGHWSYSIYLWHWPVWVFALSWLSLRRIQRKRQAKDTDGDGIACAQHRLLSLRRATDQNATGILDAAQAADELQRSVCVVTRVRRSGFSEQWFPK